MVEGRRVQQPDHQGIEETRPKRPADRDILQAWRIFRRGFVGWAYGVRKEIGRLWCLLSSRCVNAYLQWFEMVCDQRVENEITTDFRQTWHC